MKSYLLMLTMVFLLTPAALAQHIQASQVDAGGVTAGSANQVLNPMACTLAIAPSWCSGSDLGAWVNAAVKALPTVIVPVANNGPSFAYHYGTIYIPSNTSNITLPLPGKNGGALNFDTTMGNQNGCPGTLSACLPLDFVKIQCEPGSYLQYTGTQADSDWISTVDPYGTNSYSENAGGVYDCSFMKHSGHKNTERAIHVGNLTNYHIIRDTFAGFNVSGSGLSNTDVALLVENTNYFTEQLNLTDSVFDGDVIGAVFNKNCGSNLNCTDSFEHGRFHFYCGGSYGITTNCIEALGGANLQMEDLDIRFNINGSPGSALIYIDEKSVFGHNTGAIVGESDIRGKGTILVVAPGGYAELNTIWAQCAGCTSVGASSNYMDVVWPITVPGTVPVNTSVLTAGTNRLQEFLVLSITNITGGGCASGPTYTVYNNNKPIGRVVASAAVGTSSSTELSGFSYPGDTIVVQNTSIGSSCTAPMFSIGLHMGVN